MKYKKEYIALGLAGAAMAIVALGFSSYVSIPKGAKAVKPFDKNKYLALGTRLRAWISGLKRGWTMSQLPIR